MVDGEALRDLLAKAAAEVRVVDVPVNRRPWTTTGLRVNDAEAVTWLAWGQSYLIRPLGVGVGVSLGLLGRVHGGAPRVSAQPTFTFPADRDGHVEFGARFPGELHEDGSITVDRVPYRIMRGQFTAVVARWGRDGDPPDALQSLAPHDPSGLCAAEAARLTDPPHPPPGWTHHPLLGREDVYRSTPNGIATNCSHSNAIIRRTAEVPVTETLRLRWSWRVDE